MRISLQLALIMVLSFDLLHAFRIPWNLWKMVLKETGREFTNTYAFYGCHCGWGGRGPPLDQTDRCCFHHVCCYYRLHKKGCRIEQLEYVIDFKDRQLICAQQEYCRAQMCECDRAVAQCLTRNMKSYKEKYHDYVKSKCHGTTPKCPAAPRTPGTSSPMLNPRSMA
ncbi:phospholipase A2, membrane associated-like [Erinaceus europaeus]|uniref:Phospholipase A2 n=1 Tax=Erinaceus europaeus TaxID=9365 RepID=A0ABM3Y769_ERIEU|nr:phospholipase A2, membrane associated-like [Erinaceus europaeus]